MWYSSNVLVGRTVFALILGVTICTSGARAAPERPPQLIAIAFDNCTELERWEELERFMGSLQADGIRARFTFFLSGTNFLAGPARSKYTGPRQPKGTANIAFGGSKDDVEKRIGYINRFNDAGHEISSHAVGHFYGGNDPCARGETPGKQCGGRWTLAEWSQELDSFRTLFENIASNNNVGSSFGFPSGNIKGFRAPQLSTNAAMFDGLHRAGYRYDTSWPDGSEPAAWPVKNGAGLWLFKLARLRIVGLGDPRRPVSNLSMDYNICASQLRAQGSRCEVPLSDASQIEELGSQMSNTYWAYFKSNFVGNRAPLHIGHHFYPYQSGIYNRTLYRFVRAVCSLPEVQCVTYRELADYLDKAGPDLLASYQAGNFRRDGLPELPTEIATISKDGGPLIGIKPHKGRAQLNAFMIGGSGGPLSLIEWRANERVIAKGPTLRAADLPGKGSYPITVRLSDESGRVLATTRLNLLVQGARIEVERPPLEVGGGRIRGQK